MMPGLGIQERQVGLSMMAQSVDFFHAFREAVFGSQYQKGKQHHPNISDHHIFSFGKGNESKFRVLSRQTD